jgi:hypothetical protein
MEGSCEDGGEPSNSMHGGAFVGAMSDCQLLEKQNNVCRVHSEGVIPTILCCDGM